MEDLISAQNQLNEEVVERKDARRIQWGKGVLNTIFFKCRAKRDVGKSKDVIVPLGIS